MSDVNPYASPFSSDYAAPVIAQVVGPALYCKGRLLVMHKHAVLPDRCVKSNQPAHGRRLKRRLYWHHPAVYLAILANLLIYVILALILRKTATIQIGLSDAWFRKRRRAIGLGWLLFLGGAGGFVAACSQVGSQSPNAGLGILLGIAVALGGTIYGLLAARMVVPTRMTDDYIWLKGVHRDFLADLPPWPYHP